MNLLKVKKVRDVKTPSRGTQASAGLDFFIPNDVSWESRVIGPGESILIPSGIVVYMPDGTALLGLNKSGIAIKGLSVGAQLIDSDYHEEMHLHVFNHSKNDVVIKRGQKLVQFVLIPYIPCAVEDITGTEIIKTGERIGGFGSTGLF